MFTCSSQQDQKPTEAAAPILISTNDTFVDAPVCASTSTVSRKASKDNQRDCVAIGAMQGRSGRDSCGVHHSTALR